MPRVDDHLAVTFTAGALANVPEIGNLYVVDIDRSLVCAVFGSYDFHVVPRFVVYDVVPDDAPVREDGSEF